jgi:competence protein ComEC
MPLVVHFLNVGHGDCTFIEFPSGRLAMIDVNNSKRLPDRDEGALAEHHGVQPFVFKAATIPQAGYRSW